MGKLADLDGEGLGLGVSGGVGDGERVGGGFSRRVVHAARVRGPYGVRLRFELDGFCVGDTVAELHRLATANFARSGVKGLDREFLPTHLVKSGAIIRALPFAGRFAFAVFDGAVLPPAGEENPDNDESGNGEYNLRVERRLLENGFGWRNRLRHVRLIQQGFDPHDVF